MDNGTELNICVPTARVLFDRRGGSEAVVTYVLQVAYAGRRWELEKRFSEIKGLDARIPGSPPLPPFRGLHWWTNSRWDKISKRREALDVYYRQLAAYVNDAGRAEAVVRQLLEGHMENVVAPRVAVVWKSEEQVVSYMERVGLRMTASLPCDVELCGPTCRIAFTSNAAGRGLRVVLRTRFRQERSSVFRVRVAEACLLYGWAVGSPRVPLLAEAQQFLQWKRITEVSWEVALQKPSRVFPRVPSSDETSSMSSAVSSPRCDFSDTLEVEILVTPPPPMPFCAPPRRPDSAFLTVPLKGTGHPE
eukprot:TRINITY_DN2547_c1_g3_i1.p1 TRINITY_DN2547_c1_g3~~TRINITY_DN2547_c1_g3_i1.p1  ORF type:complete len:320 (+),score=36.22 TRINITY_DN2547_c1_g3_i1:48-962(+)